MPVNQSSPDVVDLRTDAVAQPTDAMWAAMQEAEVGWAMAREDPSINELQELAAKLAGKESALFVPTGTVANLVALMTWGNRGDQVVLEASSHILCCEEWGIAYIGGFLPRGVTGLMGAMPAEDVREAILEEKLRHRPNTALISIENTHNLAGGTIVTPAQTLSVASIGREFGIPIHLDGARIFNACVACGLDLVDFTRDVDSVMINLNKGLSAPAGALLIGSHDFIERSLANVKRVGAWNVSKAGIWAAAGVVALKTMIPRLADDNRRAGELARALQQIPGLSVELSSVQTNIVMVQIDPSIGTAVEVQQRLKPRGIRVHVADKQIIRLVTHRHIGDNEIDRVVDEFRSVSPVTELPASDLVLE